MLHKPLEADGDKYKLDSARLLSEVLADAHVVAVCAAVDAAVVITTDPDDINMLAAAIPGTRVVARSPRLVAPG